MAISAGMVRDLRARSGAGIMECKTALTQSDGDIEEALDFLRKKGAAKAAKKADRSTKEGAISQASEGRSAVLVETKCETDFVARNEKFQAFCNDLAEHTLKSDPAEDPDAFKSQSFALDNSKTIEQLTGERIHEVGENIVIGRRVKYDLQGEGGFGIYIHGTGGIGVLIEVGCESAETASKEPFDKLCKDLAMQIAAANPISVSSDEVPAEVLAKEKEIFETQARNSGKPDKIIPKIVEGRVKKYFSEVCLLNQAFVKDTDITISQLLDTAGKELGDKLTVRRFARLQLGE